MYIKTAVVTLLSAVLTTTINAEDLHIKDLIDSPHPADRWQGEQYKRSKEFYKKGEPKKAFEIGKYADERTKRIKEAEEFYREIAD